MGVTPSGVAGVSAAGVTWGAIVHQFGDKDSLLLAVVERGHEAFSAELESVRVGKPSPRERVSIFVDETWRHLNEPSWRAISAVPVAAPTSELQFLR